jgi:hypothetical protein
VWRIADGDCLASLQVDGPLASCAWVDDGRAVAAGGSMGTYFLRCEGIGTP